MAILARISLSFERASPPGGPTEARQLRGFLVPARTFNSASFFFARCDPGPCEFRHLSVHRRQCRRQPSHRWEAPVLAVGLGGESCVVNRCRPIFDIFVDDAGYPRRVGRHLTRLVVSFVVSPCRHRSGMPRVTSPHMSFPPPG